MGSLSPVIEAYLGGQAQQADLLNKNREWQLKQQQLQQIAKEFDINSKRQQSQLNLELQKFGLEQQIAHEKTRQQIMEGMRSGDIPIPGTTNFQSPGATTVQPNITPNIGAQPTVNGPPTMVPGQSYSVQQLPPIGTPVSVDTAFGPMTISRPQTALESTVAQQKALLPGIIAGEQAKSEIASKQYLNTVGRTKEAELANKLDVANAHNSMMSIYYENLIKSKDDATAMRETVARIQGENTANTALIRMGWGSSEMAQQTAANNVALARMGLLDTDTEKMMNPAEKNLYKQMLSHSGSVRLDPKVRTNMDQNLSSGASLLNDFQQLDQKYPAQTGTIGRAGNALATLPGLGHFTDIGQEFSRVQANIANLAKQTGETPSMARSVALAKKAEAAQIAPTDTPQVRAEKYTKLGDLVLDVVQGGLQNLPTAQKIDIWKQEMDKPIMQMLKRNIKFKPVFENILKTGDYNPSLIGAEK